MVDCFYEDVWLLITDYLDWESTACLICGTCTFLRETLAVKLCVKFFPETRTSTPDAFAANCRIMKLDETKRRSLSNLLNADVRMYARRINERGNKVDNELCLYKVRIVDYDAGRYRYSMGARVVGQHRLDCVHLDRIFAVAPDLLADSCDEDTFDDNFAQSRMLRVRDMFVERDRSILDDLRPVFGFMDAGNVLARSCQSVVVNPRLESVIRSRG